MDFAFTHLRARIWVSPRTGRPNQCSVIAYEGTRDNPMSTGGDHAHSQTVNSTLRAEQVAYPAHSPDDFKMTYLRTLMADLPLRIADNWRFQYSIAARFSES